jgi:hypothetical protein
VANGSSGQPPAVLIIFLGTLSLVANAISVITLFKDAPIGLFAACCAIGLLSGVAIFYMCRTSLAWEITGATLLVALGAFSGGIAIGNRWLKTTEAKRHVTATRTPAPPSPSLNRTDLSIEAPEDGGAVKLATDIRIHTPILGPGRHVWVLISFRLESQIYPEGECVKLDGTRYVCRKVEFGDRHTRTNTLFRVSTVVVDDRGDSTYQRFRSSGFPSAYPPVQPIAESEQITVHRT